MLAEVTDAEVNRSYPVYNEEVLTIGGFKGKIISSQTSKIS